MGEGEFEQRVRPAQIEFLAERIFIFTICAILLVPERLKMEQP
jgi:hypothetical protein